LQFARGGWPVQVQLRAQPQMEQGERGSLVTAINTQTRELSPPKAAASLSKWLKASSLRHFGTVFKKIDSTLRGSIGAELEVLLAAGFFAGAVVIPAYPAAGRITIGGRHFVHGVLLHETEFAGGSQTPGTAHVKEIIAGQLTYPVEHVDLAAIRAGGVAEVFHRAQKQGLPVLCFDAEEQEDILKAVQQLQSVGQPLLWVGSAGLAQALAEVLPGRAGDVSRPLRSWRAAERILVMAGSLSAVTRRQIARLQAVTSCPVWQLEPEELLSFDPPPLPAETPSQAGVLVITTAPRRADHPQKIAQALSRIGAETFQAWQADGLVLTGGETAVQICSRLDIHTLIVEGEIEEGIPLCLTVEGSLPVVTKAGGFGTEDALLKAVYSLQQKR